MSVCVCVLVHMHTYMCEGLKELSLTSWDGGCEEMGVLMRKWPQKERLARRKVEVEVESLQQVVAELKTTHELEVCPGCVEYLLRGEFSLGGSDDCCVHVFGLFLMAQLQDVQVEKVRLQNRLQRLQGETDFADTFRMYEDRIASLEKGKSLSRILFF